MKSQRRNKGNWDNNIHDSESCFHWEDRLLRRAMSEVLRGRAVCWKGSVRHTTVDGGHTSCGKPLKIPGTSLTSKIPLTLEPPPRWSCGWNLAGVGSISSVK